MQHFKQTSTAIVKQPQNSNRTNTVRILKQEGAGGEEKRNYIYIYIRQAFKEDFITQFKEQQQMILEGKHRATDVP